MLLFRLSLAALRCRIIVMQLQFVYRGSVLGDTQSLKSLGYSPSTSLVVTAPPGVAAPSRAEASESAASINAAIDAAYDASLAADAAHQPQ